ncbi:MAG: TonB-dependent receptor [Saprospiraceae bacterium]|nr:TonB-dependent receptor [Saprospiraceae bacterium]
MNYLSNLFSARVFSHAQILTKVCVTAVLLFSTIFLSAQTGIISGKIIDAKSAEALIGVTIRLEEGAGGAISDLDGNFRITNVAVGKHKISVNYTGYSGKNIEDIEVKAGEVSTVDIAIEESAGESLAEVVVVAKARRESTSALTIFQKNSVTMADGISSETIKRTPDRTTGDVIRRVSGASLQDGKFAIIRGLNDRYNVAMLNGALLPSTEADRKAFSFDLFPSSMIDNLVILKTASADLPGDFAGGAIIVNTKDIPEQNYLSVNVNAGVNNITTFKPYMNAASGNTDWLGTDDGSRALPAGYPSVAEYNAATPEEKVRFSQSLPNDWAITEKGSAAPNMGFQITSGLVTKAEKKVQFGSTIALSYSNQNRIQDAERNRFDLQRQLYAYRDKQFRNNVLWGALLNSALKINNNQKFLFQAAYTTNTSNSVNSREGSDFDREQYIRFSTIEFTENHLLTTRLGGEHALTPGGMKLSWGGGINRSSRDIPSLRRMTYAKNFDSEAGDPYYAIIQPGSASLNFGGRFYSELEENTLNGNIDLSIPLRFAGEKQSIKFGGLYQKRDRDFSARVLGYTATGYPAALFTLPLDQIFNPENIKSSNGFLISEITNPSDAYTASAELASGYAMTDLKLWDKLRVSAGVRLESFNMQVNSFYYGGQEVNTVLNNADLLPSANLTYALNVKHQLRFSISKTLSRPEFRELSPFAFYDYEEEASVQGNPGLVRGTIFNYDVRYECYPGANQLLSVSLFYKKFFDPIERNFSSSGGGTTSFGFQNVTSAENYGAELEARKNFDFLGDWGENLLLFTNVAFIGSTIDLTNVDSYDPRRALQGQSPYIVNSGLTANFPKWGLGTTLAYNIIGDRVAYVGTDNFADIYERHRNLLDFSISKKISSRGEVKLTWGDILRPDFIYYQDNNSSHTYEPDVDNLMQRRSFGSTVTLGLGYRF